MKYNDIIKNSKFYLPINLNLGYLLSDTEIMIMMTVIHCHEIGVKVSVSKLESFTARAESTIKRALKRLRTLKLVSEQGYAPCLEQIGMVYDSVNSAKSIEERKKWCEAYKGSKGQIEPLMVGQSEPMKMGQNEPSNKGQFEPTYKEDINKEDLYKENTINKEDLKYNIYSNILGENTPFDNNIEESEDFEKDFALVTEGVGGNLNESKSKIERNEDSNLSQPLERNPSSIEEVNNHEEATPKVLSKCSKYVKTLYVKVGRDLHTLLQELAQCEGREQDYRTLVARLDRDSKVSDDTKELAHSLASFWGIELY